MSPEISRQRYEQLRQQALAGQDASRTWGLNLLQTRGVAAWVKAASEDRLPSSSPVMPPRLPVTDGVSLPESVQHQMATLLAEMILRRNPEVVSGSFS
jgi:hypothetical protein